MNKSSNKLLSTFQFVDLTSDFKEHLYVTIQYFVTWNRSKENILRKLKNPNLVLKSSCEVFINAFHECDATED